MCLRGSPDHVTAEMRFCFQNVGSVLGSFSLCFTLSVFGSLPCSCPHASLGSVGALMAGLQSGGPFPGGHRQWPVLKTGESCSLSRGGSSRDGLIPVTPVSHFPWNRCCSASGDDSVRLVPHFSF